MKHTEIALERPVTTIVVFVALALVGLIASRLLPLEKFPDIEFPAIIIEIPYDGSTPEEVEQELLRLGDPRAVVRPGQHHVALRHARTFGHEGLTERRGDVLEGVEGRDDPEGGATAARDVVPPRLVPDVAVITETESWSADKLERAHGLANVPEVDLPTGSALIRTADGWELVGDAEVRGALPG